MGYESRLFINGEVRSSACCHRQLTPSPNFRANQLCFFNFKFRDSASKTTFDFVGTRDREAIAVLQEAGAEDVEAAVAAAEVRRSFRHPPLNRTSFRLLDVDMSFHRQHGLPGQPSQLSIVPAFFSSGRPLSPSISRNWLS